MDWDWSGCDVDMRRRARAFDPDADITAQIVAAITDSVDPAGTLRDLWPWVPDDARRRLQRDARTREEPARVLAERYQHVIRAEWGELPVRVRQKPERRRWFRGGGTS